ncbi:Modifier of mdg4 [Operophtera brumata]|uniref:Modifier of mdg4 n=1 Tax=Operophtera brumata TaxID=104452 RepID=A0A0L7L2T7_OPEBR|nr:Modifier of mdg4 [Operophtera brumata]
MNLEVPIYDLSLKGGKVLVLDGFRYSIACQSSRKTLWYCNRLADRGCKARISTIEDVVVNCINEHTHPPKQNIYVSDKPVFSVSPRGARIMIMGGYKYTVHIQKGMKTRWFCATHRNHRCNAALYTVEDVVVKYGNQHSHPPLNLSELYRYLYKRL